MRRAVVEPVVELDRLILDVGELDIVAPPSVEHRRHGPARVLRIGAEAGEDQRHRAHRIDACFLLLRGHRIFLGVVSRHGQQLGRRAFVIGQLHALLLVRRCAAHRNRRRKAQSPCGSTLPLAPASISGLPEHADEPAGLEIGAGLIGVVPEDAAIGRMAEGDEPEAQIIGHIDGGFCLRRDGGDGIRVRRKRLGGHGRQHQPAEDGACPQQLTTSHFRHIALPAKLARSGMNRRHLIYMSPHDNGPIVTATKGKDRRHRCDGRRGSLRRSPGAGPRHHAGRIQQGRRPPARRGAC